MVGIGDLVRNAAGADPEEAAAVQAALEQAVVHKVTSPAKPDGSGLSIFPPYANPNHAELLVAYEQHTPFSESYKSFVCTYAQTLFEGVAAAGSRLNFLTQAPEVQFLDQGTQYTAQLDPPGIGDLAEIAFVLGAVSTENENHVLLLYSDTEIDALEPKTGLMESLWPETVWTLNGQPIPLLLMNESETAQEFMVPAFVNDQLVNLIVVWHREAGA